MKLRIRLLAISTLLATLTNFSFPVFATNSTTAPKSSKTTTIPKEVSKSEQADLATQYTHGVIMHRLSTILQESYIMNPNSPNGRNKIHQLIQILEQLISVSRTIDNPVYQAKALNTVVAVYEAIEYHTLLNSPNNVEIKEKFIKTFYSRALNSLNKSVQVTNEINDPKEKFERLSEIASLYMALEQKEKSAQVLKQIFELSNKTQNVNEKSVALSRLIEKYLYSNRILLSYIFQTLVTINNQSNISSEQTINKLILALQIANNIPIDEHKDKVLATIAEEYIHLQQYEPTFQIAQNIKNNSLKVKILTTIISSHSWEYLNRINGLPSRAAETEIQLELNSDEILTKIFQVVNTVNDTNSRDQLLSKSALGYIDAFQQTSVFIANYPYVKWSTAHPEKSYLIDQALIITNNIKNPNVKYDILSKISSKLTESSIRFLYLNNSAVETTEATEVKKQLGKYFNNQALEIANSIPNSQIKSHNLAMITFNLIRYSTYILLGNGNTEERKQGAKDLKAQALEIANTIPDSQIRAKTLGIIAFNIFITSHKKPPTILNTPKVSKQVSKSNTNNVKKIADEDEQLKKQLYKESFEILDRIKTEPIKSEILAEIATYFARKAPTESEIETYILSIKLAKNIQINSIQNAILKEITESYINQIKSQDQTIFIKPIKNEQKDKYFELLSLVLEIAKYPSYEKTLNPIIAALFLEVGEVDRAFQIINTLTDDETKFYLLSKVAAQYAIAGESEKSDNIFAQILHKAETNNNAYQKASELYIIAAAYSTSRRSEEASKIITQARRIALTVNINKTTRYFSKNDSTKPYKNLLKMFGSPGNSHPIKNRSNSIDMIDFQSLLFRIDNFMNYLNMRGEYQPVYRFNHRLQSLVAESKYKEALELVQQSRSRMLVDLINRPSISTLVSSPRNEKLKEYFEQLKAKQSPPPPKINQIQRIAQERQVTLVEYAIVYRDTQSQDVTQNIESELFIWVVKPTGEVAFRRVNLSFFGQQNLWLTQLASNPELFVRGLMQELKVNTQKIHPALLVIIVFGIGSILCLTLWYLCLFLKHKFIFNTWIHLCKLNRRKPKNIPRRQVNYLFYYTSNTSLFPPKVWRFWLLLTLLLAGGGGVFFWRNISRQQIIANRHSEIIVSRNKALPQTQSTNNQADNSLLASLISDSRESMGVRGRGLGLVAKVEKPKQTSRLQQLHHLLIEPIADLLPKEASSTVVFIPTKSLFFVPFSALQDKEGKYLIEKHTILTAPSIQVLDLAYQRRQKIQKSTNRDVLVVGNPTMPILVSADGKPPEKLSPLPGAEQEARAIASLFNTKPLIGSDATEPVVLWRMLTARIIHIATHGLLDPIYQWKQSPGAIALAPLQDNSTMLLPHELEYSSRKPEYAPWLPPSDPVFANKELLDGFFYLDGEGFIPTPPLSAELVVLSACDTGRGQLTEDGVVGLSRSFITAGVPSIIVSLWAIPDAPTAFLMTEFYRNWQKTGDKAQALRQAMLTTMKQHPDPRNWAAFTLIGDSK